MIATGRHCRLGLTLLFTFGFAPLARAADEPTTAPTCPATRPASRPAARPTVDLSARPTFRVGQSWSATLVSRERVEIRPHKSKAGADANAVRQIQIDRSAEVTCRVEAVDDAGHIAKLGLLLRDVRLSETTGRNGKVDQTLSMSLGDPNEPMELQARRFGRVLSVGDPNDFEKSLRSDEKWGDIRPSMKRLLLELMLVPYAAYPADDALLLPPKPVPVDANAYWQVPAERTRAWVEANPQLASSAGRVVENRFSLTGMTDTGLAEIHGLLMLQVRVEKYMAMTPLIVAARIDPATGLWHEKRQRYAISMTMPENRVRRTVDIHWTLHYDAPATTAPAGAGEPEPTDTD